MSQKLKDLQAKRQQLAADVHAHADKQANWTAEDRQKWEALNAAYDANMAELTAERAAVEAEAKEREEIAAKLRGVNDYKDFVIAANPLAGRDGGMIADGPRNASAFGMEKDRESFVRNQFIAFHGWLLNTSDGLQEHVTDEHRTAAKVVRASLTGKSFKLRLGNTGRFNRLQAAYRNGTTLGVGGEAVRIRNAVQDGVGSKGGFLVGETLLNRLEAAVLDYSGVMQVAEVMRTDTGETLHWPTVDDTANSGSRVGEDTDAGIATSVDPKFGRLNLQAFIYHSNFINISRAFLTDASVDLEGMLGDMMGTRIGRKRNADYTTGADVGNGPIGLVTQATATTTNKQTAASSTALAFDDLVDVVHKIDPARRRMGGVGYMFHDKILQIIRKFKDGIARPLWVSGAAAGLPDTINDYPFWINQSMDSTTASGKNTVLFGQLTMYKVREVNGIEIKRLEERRAEFYEDAFIAYARSDGGLLDPGDHPVAYVQH